MFCRAPLKNRTPRTCSGRPQSVGLIHAAGARNTQTVESPHHSLQSTNNLKQRAIDLFFLFCSSHHTPVSRIFHSTGEIVLYLDSLFSSSFRHLYNYFGATFRRFFSSKSTSDFEVSNLVAPTETTESRRGARVRSFPSAI